MISDSHPLREFFSQLVTQHFAEGVGIRDQEVAGYVSNMLTEFCEFDQLLRIRNSSGRQLDDVGEMLLESDPVFGPAASFDRERQVRKHIGDYTLFFAGMFPEAVNRFRLRSARLENLIDFVKAGKESYYIVSRFDVFEYKKVAPLFARLSREFESCVYGLNLVKNDLSERQHPLMHQASELIM
ncbi:MAG TPA: hypothetical protein VKB56_01200 [Terriglobales bacterium]|jgi:hypothetical protein|nr:hypothetical protein [Terriglobales bacterium]